MVPLFAGVLHNSDVRLEGPVLSNGPGSRIGFGIVDGIRMLGMAVIHAPERVDEVRLIAERVADRIHARVAIEVACVNDQLVSFPVPDRVPKPGRRKSLEDRADIGGANMEPRVRFRQEYKIVSNLDDLNGERTVD